ncbi:MAG: T9SS type A sorting domain-containing protein [Bacteroidia bacterium]
MRKTILSIWCCMLLAGTMLAQPDCSANAGPNITVCYTAGSFTLLGEPATGSVNANPNYTWTGPAGFIISNPNALQTTVTQAGGLIPGTYTFTLSADCVNGPSFNSVSVLIGDDPVEPTSISASNTGCNQVTVTALPPPGPGDSGQWTWTPFDNDLGIISGGGSNVASFERNDDDDCTGYIVNYTIVNGGCESTTISTGVNPENLAPVSADSDEVYCSTEPVGISHNGSFPGCAGAAVSWTQVGGPTIGFTQSGTNLSFTMPVPAVSETYTFQYAITPAAGSLCQGGSDVINFTINNGTGFDLGPDETYYFCGDFPSSTQIVCANPGGTLYNWGTGPGGVAISPVPGQIHCQNVDLPQGPGAPTLVYIDVETDTSSGPCVDRKVFRFVRLPDVNTTTGDVGIGCAPDGVVDIDILDYVTGYIGGWSADVIINSVPPTSGIPAPSQTGRYFSLDVEGCYDFTVIISINSDQCADTLDLTICRYATVEQPNAGADQSVCAETATLNGSTPTQTGTDITWTQLPSNLPGATILDPDATDPMVIGLDNSTNGTVYGFVYTFSLDAPAGVCELSDTVYITIDCQVMCDSFYLSSCCEIELESGANGNISGSDYNRRRALREIKITTGQRRRVSAPFPDACDPCIDGWYPVWIEDENGNPVGFNDPCILVEWLDENGVVLSTGWAFPATPDIRFTVRVTNTCNGCVWTDNFFYCCEELDPGFTVTTECTADNFIITVTNITPSTNSLFQIYTATSACIGDPCLLDFMNPDQSSSGNTVTFTLPKISGAMYMIKHGEWNLCEWNEVRRLVIDTCCIDMDIEIHTHCDSIGGPIPVPISSQAVASMYQSYNSSHGTSFSPVNCDFCANPTVPFVIFVTDDAGNLLSGGMYSISWSSSTGATSSGDFMLAFVNESYYVEVRGPNNCLHRDTFTINCCKTPLNPTCSIKRNNLIGLTWDPVAGAQGYEILITAHDPLCCSEGTGQQPVIFGPFTVTGTAYIPNVSYICASWRVRAICNDGMYSEYTEPQCICRLTFPSPGTNNKTVNDAETTLRIYPSPASNYITVDGLEGKTGARLILFDTSGRVLISDKVRNGEKQRINTSAIANGVYFLKVQGIGADAKAKKVVILH